MAVSADVDTLLSGDLGSWLNDQVAVRAAAKDKAHWRWTFSNPTLWKSPGHNP